MSSSSLSLGRFETSVGDDDGVIARRFGVSELHNANEESQPNPDRFSDDEFKDFLRSLSREELGWLEKQVNRAQFAQEANKEAGFYDGRYTGMIGQLRRLRAMIKTELNNGKLPYDSKEVLHE